MNVWKAFDSSTMIALLTLYTSLQWVLTYLTALQILQVRSLSLLICEPLLLNCLSVLSA